MHAKQKGNVAASATTLILNQLDYHVFAELGDLSRIDLIAEKDSRLIKIQVKGITPKNGRLELCFTKSGPNYTFCYKPSDFDIFAVCNLNTLEVAWIPSWIIDSQRTISLRVEKSKNNQLKGVNLFSDYMDFESMIARVA